MENDCPPRVYDMSRSDKGCVRPVLADLGRPGTCAAVQLPLKTEGLVAPGQRGRRQCQLSAADTLTN